MAKKIYISILFVVIGLQLAFSQKNNTVELPKLFSIKVKVVDDKMNLPITNATVRINGMVFPYSNTQSRYIIKARAGDELVVTHPDFTTVYYTIKDDEDIKVEVRDFIDRRRSSKRAKKMKAASFDEKKRYSKSKKTKVDLYNINLDSAKYYKEKSFDKSLSFIQNILSVKESNNRNAATYNTLADIYRHWKQYDLAIANYTNSLNYNDKASTKISLAQVYVASENFKKAKETFELILKQKKTKFEQVLIYEGLGDVYLGLKEYKKSKENYQEGLKIALDNTIQSKVTDINSKLGDVYAAEGNLVKAKESFANAISAAKKENTTRSIKEKDKVADFLNTYNEFDDEIKLRKESLEEFLKKDTLSFNQSDNRYDNIGVGTKLNEKDSTLLVSDVNAITPQSINYKIGRAYTQKGEYQKAIPFLKNSINEPNKFGDIEIKKDATRKLSETFAAVGEYDKALTTYQDYVKLVDQLYVKKGQEINNAKRFGQTLADNQNRIAVLEKNKELSDSLIKLAAKDQQLNEERNRNQLIIIYGLIAGILTLFTAVYFLFRSNRQQKLTNNLLALKSMRSQMNPHFIFNALNSVNSFIAVNDERNANRYLSEFSALMRSVLENSDEDFIPLSKEIELLELYVKLEHNRFKDKFDYTIEIDKNINLEQFLIPPMLLQPYIENAIWHGLRYKKEIGKLSINITKKDLDAVIICIQDDGVGRKKSMELKTKNQLKQKSKGMSTIQSRIAILNDMYEDRISVQVSDVLESGEGTKVELLLKRK
ncbi:MAG: histidine kinase [Flavobacteriaceae bacterium]